MKICFDALMAYHMSSQPFNFSAFIYTHGNNTQPCLS